MLEILQPAGRGGRTISPQEVTVEKNEVVAVPKPMILQPLVCTPPEVMFCPGGNAPCQCALTGGPSPPLQECKVTITYPPGRPDQAQHHFDGAGCTVASYEIAIAVVLANLLKMSGF